MRLQTLWIAIVAMCISGCAADYLNNYDTATLASGDANNTNQMLQTVDPFNPDGNNTHIEGDGARAVAIVEKLKSGGGGGYRGNCPTDNNRASDGSRCGGRSAESRAGGQP
jgi:hypothetical protein